MNKLALTNDELDQFVNGILQHCGDLVNWARCSDHDNCMSATCYTCNNSWCDVSDGE